MSSRTLRSYQKEAVKAVRNEHRNKRHHPLIKDVFHEFDSLGKLRKKTCNFLWADICDGEWSLADDNNNEIVIQPQDDGFIATIFFQSGEIEDIISKPKTLDDCIETCENFAQKRLKIIYADLNKPWLDEAKKEKATLKQRNFLQGYGRFFSGMNKAKALVEIRTIFALQRKEERRQGFLITEKQKLVLS